MSTSWPSLTANQVLSGQAAKTNFADLWDRAVCARQKGVTLYFAEVSALNDTYSDDVTFLVRVPSYVREGNTMSLTFGIRCLNATDTSYGRWRETSGPVNGTEVSVAGTDYGWVTSVITVPSDDWAGTVKTFAVQLRDGGAGTAYGKADGIGANLRVSD